jgi:hypothetical protein
VHYRAGCLITSSRSDLQASATESIPPAIVGKVGMAR